MIGSNRAAAAASSRRRTLLQAAVAAVAAAVGALATPTAFAQAAPREGVDYTVVRPAQPTTAAAGKIEVIEFFGYWCPHCNDFEPTLVDWTKRNDAKITMVHVPIAFAPAQANLQKLYYTLDALGKERDLRRKVFTSIHDDRSLSPAADVGNLADWAEKNGIEKKKFIDTLNSFSVSAKVNRANQIAAAYGVTGVPMLAIGGKYLLNIQARTIGYADQFLARAITEK